MSYRITQAMPASLNTIELAAAHIIEHANQSIIRSHSAKSKKSPPLVVGFALDLEWRASVSNSHNCPHDGETNWGNTNPHAPRGYPGWTGRVWMRASNSNYPGFWSDHFGGTGIHTGSGGFGSYDGMHRTISILYHAHQSHLRSSLNDRKISKTQYNSLLNEWPEPQLFSYQCEMFESDWPGLSQTDAIDLAERYLSTGVRPERPRLTFSWEHPDQVELDRQMRQAFKNCAGCNPGTVISGLTNNRNVVTYQLFSMQ
jgi:hypothetical protein